MNMFNSKDIMTAFAPFLKDYDDWKHFALINKTCYAIFKQKMATLRPLVTDDHMLNLFYGLANICAGYCVKCKRKLEGMRDEHDCPEGIYVCALCTRHKHRNELMACVGCDRLTCGRCERQCSSCLASRCAQCVRPLNVVGLEFCETCYKRISKNTFKILHLRT